MIFRAVVFLLSIPFLVSPLFAQSNVEGGPSPESEKNATLIAFPNLFIDCDFCDRNYLRRELNFTNHVRDKEDADIYVLITSQSTGSGGRAYRMAFSGNNEFDGITHTLEHASRQDETDDERRRGRLQVMKMGLMPYLAVAGLTDQFDIGFEEAEIARIGLGQDDPWNSWVYNIFVGGGYQGEESQREVEFDGGVTVRRVTEALKVIADFDIELEQDEFDNGDEHIQSNSSEVDFDFLLVKSIDPNWSYGFISGYRSDTFTNLDNQYDLNPAIEYNFYPWEESDRRLITIAYFPGLRHVQYNEETIYGKMSETLLSHSLRVQMDFEQPWGELFAQLEGSQLLNDLGKNSLEVFSRVDVRVARGLSVFLRGSAEIIHDQLFLPKGNASLEEVLLRRRQLATNFEVSGSIGLRLTFGSAYNNVVNQRL